MRYSYRSCSRTTFHPRTWLVLIAGLTCASPAGPASAQAVTGDTPVAIGLGKQLLVDDHVIARTSHVTRELGRVTKANGGKPVIVADKPWEDLSSCIIGSVFRDEGKFKMYYKVGYGELEPGDPPGTPKPKFHPMIRVSPCLASPSGKRCGSCLPTM